jgi:hypothetical protein
MALKHPRVSAVIKSYICVDTMTNIILKCLILHRSKPLSDGGYVKV